MKCCLIAVGRNGIRACRALLDAAMTGLVDGAEIRFILIGVPSQDTQMLESLVKDYESVRLRLEKAGFPGFTSRFQMDMLAEEGLDASLEERCESEADRLLLSCLFPMDRSLRRSASSSVETAQAAWADLLEGGGPAALGRLADEKDDTLTILCGSLTETIFAGGVVQLTNALRERGIKRLGAVIGLPMHQKDRTDLAGAALKEMPPLEALYLLGLPEDMRTPGDGFEELFYLRCMDHFLHGGQGMYTYAQIMETPEWSVFAEHEERYRAAICGLLSVSCLMLLRYGPEASERLEHIGTGAMRGWFGRVYGEVRRNPELGSRERVWLRSVLHLLRFHLAWCYMVSGNLPLNLRYQAQLQETLTEAEKHYDRVLELAGRIALLKKDLQDTGLLEEKTVRRHHYSEEAAEGERARGELDTLLNRMNILSEEAERFEAILGGRAALMMLQGKLETCQKEEESLRLQGEEAERRINAAARLAGPEEQPKIDAARSRLNNLRRNLAVLQGRVTYVSADVERARREENRNRKPQVNFLEDQEPNVLFDRRLLREMITAYDKQSSERRNLSQSLLGKVREVDMLHVMDRLEHLSQTMNGTADLMATLQILCAEETTGRRTT